VIVRWLVAFTVLQSVAVCCIVLHCVPVCCSVFAVCCSVLQFVAACYGVFQYATVPSIHYTGEACLLKLLKNAQFHDEILWSRLDSIPVIWSSGLILYLTPSNRPRGVWGVT